MQPIASVRVIIRDLDNATCKDRLVFNFIKSKLAIARGEYWRCQRHRQHCLTSFRRAAGGEIRLLYPDATILMGTTYRNFIFYSRASDVLSSGEFNDDMFPSLAPVAESGSLEDYQIAIDEYKKRLSAYGPSTPWHQRALLENPDLYFYRLGEEAKSDLFGKGYRIHQGVDGDRIIAAEVCINEVRVSSASCLNPKSGAYHAEKIYRNVLSKSVPSENGLSAISLTLVVFDFCSIGSFYYERLYDDNTNFRGEAGLDSFKSNFSDFINFIRSIEHRVNSWPEVIASDRKGWIEPMESFVEGF